MRKSSYRILVLEDEALLRGLLAITLQRHGFQVLSGGSREEGEAIKRIAWREVDLILSDACLSRDPAELEGYAFHAAWKAQYPVPPTVFMLGHPTIPKLAETGDCLVFHLRKPFIPSELIRLLIAILDV